MKLFAKLVILLYPPLIFASASTNSIALSHNELIAIGIAALPWTYAANKWWRWKIGFQVGGARLDVFVSALKWSLIALVWSVVSLGIMYLIFGEAGNKIGAMPATSEAGNREAAKRQAEEQRQAEQEAKRQAGEQRQAEQTRQEARRQAEEAARLAQEEELAAAARAEVQSAESPEPAGNRIGATPATSETHIHIDDLVSALDIYRLEVGYYPTTSQGLNALVQQPEGVTGWSGPYLRSYQMLKDPWGFDYYYRSPGQHSSFDLWSLGADNRVGGLGENKDLFVNGQNESLQSASPNQPAQPFPPTVVQSKPIPQNNPERPNFNPAPNPPVQTPTVKEGDIYIFETKDPENPKSTIMTKRRVDSVGTKIRLSTININNKNAKARNLTYDRDWNLMSTRNADKSGLDYYPPLKYYDFPLMPGKNWNQSSIETDIKSGKTRTHTFMGVVEGWENVSVPAGNFRAIKVSLQTEVIDSITGEVISGTDDSWFVPEIGRSVKSITSGKDGQKRIIQLMWYQLAER